MIREDMRHMFKTRLISGIVLVIIALATIIIGGPLLLSRGGRTNYAADFAESTGIKVGFVLGGKTLISDDDARTIFQMGADGEIIVK
jgi:hypothetical protein